MPRLNLAALALPLLLAACAKTGAGGDAAVDTAKITEAVKADVAQLVSQLNAKDVDKAVSHDAPDIVGMFHGQANITSPAEDAALTKQQLGDAAFKLSTSDESVDVAKAGDMAIYRAKYAAEFTDPVSKKPVHEAGNWVAQYKKQADGSWKVALNIISDTPAAAPAAGAAAAPAAPAAAAPAKK
jgi:ketosteroid isomerase-like protein